MINRAGAKIGPSEKSKCGEQRLFVFILKRNLIVHEMRENNNG